jgi:membrane associated rhomboid family serine protease
MMTMETPIGTTRYLREAEEWALVLAAAEIPHRLEATGAGWTVFVPAVDALRAQAALADSADEVSGGPPVAIVPPTSASVSWAIGVAAGAGLLAFFAVTGPADSDVPWFARGAASASRIAAGEWWRAATALTLHVDARHVASNAVATAVSLTAVVHRLGPGLGLGLTVLAGAGANLLAALQAGSHHEAVGASTATFGAIGILAGLQLLPRSSARGTRARPWMVVVAAILLLAMLGAGQGSDVLGHALGLGCGMALGLASGVMLRRPLGSVTQWALVATTGVAIVGCWLLALAGTATPAPVGHRVPLPGQAATGRKPAVVELAR